MIVSAALLQRELGIQGTTFPEVLAHSGAPRGSTYHHFPGGRAQLAEEATRFAADFISDGIAEQLRIGSPQAALAVFIDGWRQVLEATQFTAGCAVAAAALDSEPDSTARAAAGAGFTRWQTLLAEAWVRAGVGDALARSYATLVVASVEGAIVLARGQRSMQPLDDVAYLLTKLTPLQVPDS